MIPTAFAPFGSILGFLLISVQPLAELFSAHSSCSLAYSQSCSSAALLLRCPYLVELSHYPFRAILASRFLNATFVAPRWTTRNPDYFACIEHIWFCNRLSLARVYLSTLHVLPSSHKYTPANHLLPLFSELLTPTICKQPLSCLLPPRHCQRPDQIPSIASMYLALNSH